MILSKQCVGIDIGKETFTACLALRYQDGNTTVSEVVEFINNRTGFNKLMRWVGKKIQKSLPVFYVMEATGIYYEQLAYHLTKLNKNVSVVLANKVTHFAKSMNVKSKTDSEDAKLISRMGAERKLQLWSPPIPLFRNLRSLTRLYGCLQKDKTMTTNRLSALNCSYEPNALAVKTYKDIVKKLDKKLVAIMCEIKILLKSDKEVWNQVLNLCTIPGLGILTVALVLGETQGFKLFKNQRQLISFCGLDVIQRQSGISIKGKTKISKKGNSYIRAALFLPALSASQHNKQLKTVYHRINENKKIKMIGVVALQRRLLVLMYTLWKTNSPYIENYEKLKSGFHEEGVPSSSSTRRVEYKASLGKVDGAQRLTSTQNGHLYDQSSDALLRL